jgi:hypothetical protein
MPEVYVESPFDLIVDCHFGEGETELQHGTGGLHGAENVASPAGGQPAHPFASGYSFQYQTGAGVTVGGSIGVSGGSVAISLHGASFGGLVGTPQSFSFSIHVKNLATGAEVMSAGPFDANTSASVPPQAWGPATGSAASPSTGMTLQPWLAIEDAEPGALEVAFGGVSCFMDVVLN